MAAKARARRFPVRVDLEPDLERFWRFAGWIGVLSNDDHQWSFTTLFITFLNFSDPACQLVQKLAAEGQTDLDAIYESRRMDQGLLSEARAKAEKADPKSNKLEWTSSTEGVCRAANILRREASPEKALGTRHLLAAYLYGKIGAYHEDQLAKWRIDRAVWSSALIAELGSVHPEDLPVWKRHHEEQYGQMSGTEASGTDASQAEASEAEASGTGTSETVASETRFTDGVALQSDHPTDQDELNREAFARSLASRLNVVRRDGLGRDEAFMAHLYARWGEGKTSLLRLLGKKLTEGEGDPAPMKWRVVFFNAWRHQHLDPPWWPLLDTIFRESYRGLRAENRLPFRAWWFWVREQFRRLFAGTARRILGLLVVVWLAVALVWFAWPSAPEDSTLETLKGIAEAGSAVLGLLVSLWGSVKAFGNSLAPSTIQAADRFTRVTWDPMKRLKLHFKRLVDRIGRPVAIFIDDVDRCQPEYVVGLLEGVQNLFRSDRVLYVVAGDRKWIHTCFEKVYSDFKDDIQEPGRRLGSLFLEKAFQLSFALPRLQPSVRDAFWRSLVRTSPSEERMDVQSMRARAAEMLEALETPEQRFHELAQERDEVFDQVFREEMVARMAEDRIEAETRHFLTDFSALIEPNPRSMKRLVNAFALLRDTAILVRIPIETSVAKQKQLALWSIVTMRWPDLVPRLFRDPQLADDAIAGKTDAIPNEAVQRLLSDPEVQEVFKGGETGVELDSDAVKEFGVLSGL